MIARDGGISSPDERRGEGKEGMGGEERRRGKGRREEVGPTSFAIGRKKSAPMAKCGDTGVQCDEANGRLPRPSPFIPVHYELELQPDIYRPAPPFPLSGHVSIHVHCGAQTETMTLNMDSSVNVVNLSIVALSSSDQQPPAINHVRFTRNKQTMFIQYIG